MRVQVETGVQTYLTKRHHNFQRVLFFCPADVSGVTIHIKRAKKNKTSEEKAK